MSEALTKVVERTSTDATFRSKLQSDPTSALAGYALTSDERAAVLSGEPGPHRGAGRGRPGVEDRQPGPARRRIPAGAVR